MEIVILKIKCSGAVFTEVDGLSFLKILSSQNVVMGEANFDTFHTRAIYR